MMYIFTSDKKYFNISTSPLINGSGGEIFPEFEQGVTILVNFLLPFYLLSSSEERILSLPVP